MKTVIPSNPYDAKGLLIAAIEGDDPVVIFEPKRLYNGPFDGYPDKPVTPWQKIEGNLVPEGHYTVPLGKARIAREGVGAARSWPMAPWCTWPSPPPRRWASTPR